MAGSDGELQSDGRRALAISNAIARLHHEYYGRGPNRTRTINLDEDDIDDLALTVQIGDLCDTLSGELDVFANRNGSRT